MTLLRTYVKDKQIVYVYDKFIYCSSVYKFYDNVVELVDEKYYSSNIPIKLKKKDISVKKKNYSLYRFFNLQFAPEDYLIKNGFKILENEEGNS